jgi:hypothetical protein
MPYATVAQLKAYLDQVVDKDDLLADILDRASALIDLEIGHSWATAGAGAATVYGEGTNYLRIPAPYIAGSVTLLTGPVDITLPSYIERDGYLVARTSDAYLYPARQGMGVAGFGPGRGAWMYGVPYVISATYGYGAAPAALIEACLEIAADMYRFRDAGSIKAAGAADGGLVRGGALPVTAARILANIKASETKVWVR